MGGNWLVWTDKIRSVQSTSINTSDSDWIAEIGLVTFVVNNNGHKGIAETAATTDWSNGHCEATKNQYGEHCSPPSVDIYGIYVTPERDNMDKEALDVEHQVTQVSFELLTW